MREMLHKRLQSLTESRNDESQCLPTSRQDTMLAFDPPLTPIEGESGLSQLGFMVGVLPAPGSRNVALLVAAAVKRMARHRLLGRVLPVPKRLRTSSRARHQRRSLCDPQTSANVFISDRGEGAVF